MQGIKVMPHLVRGQYAQVLGIGGEILQAVIAGRRADYAHPGDAHGGPVKIAVSPQLSYIMGLCKAGRPPGSETVEQGIGVCAGSPGVGSRAGRDVLLYDDELDFIGKFIVPVAGHIVHDGYVVVLYGCYAAVLLKHEAIGSDGQLNFVAVACFVQVIGDDLFLFVIYFLNTTALSFYGDDVGGFVSDIGVGRRFRQVIGERLNVVVVISFSEIGVEEIFGDGYPGFGIFLPFLGIGFECDAGGFTLFELRAFLRSHLQGVSGTCEAGLFSYQRPFGAIRQSHFEVCNFVFLKVAYEVFRFKLYGFPLFKLLVGSCPARFFFDGTELDTQLCLNPGAY